MKAYIPIVVAILGGIGSSALAIFSRSMTESGQWPRPIGLALFALATIASSALLFAIADAAGAFLVDGRIRARRDASQS